jgi:BirA family transcriptional regulator, biotin operon repressor / biotin---[acetyl-CoA-carboxylase] ligase
MRPDTAAPTPPWRPVDAANVQPLLRGRLGRTYVYAERVPSTQALARGLPHGGVAACEEQTAGRGRLGRGWTCPYGRGVLLSIALRPRTPPERLAPLSLVIAEAVCEATHPHARVRWPNDVVVDGRKLAGVLPELRDGELVVGIGLNADLRAEDLPADARVPATSLRLLRGGPVDRPPLVAELLERVERRFERFEQHGFEGVGRDDLRGRQVTLVRGAEGSCDGIDGEGRLVVAGRPHTSAEVQAVRT